MIWIIVAIVCFVILMGIVLSYWMNEDIRTMEEVYAEPKEEKPLNPPSWTE